MTVDGGKRSCLAHTATFARLSQGFFWCAPSYGAPARSRERRAARMVTLSRAPACRCREMVACMCRQTDSLPVGIGRVQLPPGRGDGVGGRAAKRRLCAVHTAHKRTPPVATFDTGRADLKTEPVLMTPKSWQVRGAPEAQFEPLRAKSSNS